jgi:hypothetical protein
MPSFDIFSWVIYRAPKSKYQSSVSGQVKEYFGGSKGEHVIAFFLWRWVLYKYTMKNILRTAKFLPTWGFNQRYFLGL